MSNMSSTQASFSEMALFERYGRIRHASGATVKVTGQYAIGQICKISGDNGKDTFAEVVGFDGDLTVLTPFGSINGISPISKVSVHSNEFEVPVGEELCGHVVDALGNPVEGYSKPKAHQKRSIIADPPPPMTRPVIDEVFPLGIRAIDSLLTCGVGQRMGIFAAAGVGKSVLLSSFVRNAQYDKCVVCLIGERGREVREFLEVNLDAAARENCVVVVATSDRPAIEQVNAAYTATTIAEYFRDQGDRVLLLVDSLTRFARAQRQIGLSIGEPPTRRGYPPSVFERLPKLVERTGTSQHGSITAFYTVLLEGDDVDEPVADEVRSLLDGHIILSRDLANEGHYPAIDVMMSKSRLYQAVASAEQQELAGLFRTYMNRYNDVKLLLQVGEYASGSDPITDSAIRVHPALMKFLQQTNKDVSDYNNTLEQLKKTLYGRS